MAPKKNHLRGPLEVLLKKRLVELLGFMLSLSERRVSAT